MMVPLESGLIRVVLVLGLAAHKLLWEVLKRRRPQVVPERGPRGLMTVVAKTVKIFVLTFLVLQTLFLDILPIAAEPAAVRGIGFGFFLCGLAFAMVGRLQLGRNWADLEDYTILPDQMLVARGLYRYVRHPIYAGDVVLLMGLELALNSWLVLGVVPVVLVVVRQAFAEEHLLQRVLPGYAEYCTRTKRFIPLIV
jgi:protein-S-isoprenylcysteine O-methyltransferase Ste14